MQIAEKTLRCCWRHCCFSRFEIHYNRHTLCDQKNPILLEPMEFLDPVIEIAVEPKTKGDQEKMGEALARLAKEDPSFRVFQTHGQDKL